MPRLKDGKGKNVGDWSEIYVFFRIMETGRLQSADCDMNPIADAYLPVLKIIREEETNKLVDYYTSKGGDSKVLEVYSNGELVRKCTIEEFKEAGDLLLTSLQNAIADPKTKTASMHFRDIEDFLESIKIYAIKAPSRAISKNFGGKSDITMLIQQRDGLTLNAGFSVKSSLSSPATLGNSSNACNFYFELPGCNDEIMLEVNAIEGSSKIVSRARKIAEHGIDPIYIGVGSITYKKNLMLIGADTAQALARALWLAYSKSEGRKVSKKKLTDALVLLCDDDPLSLFDPNDDSYHVTLYRKRLVDYLMAIACGMNPDEPWDARLVIKGGYVFVTKRGDVLAYYAADEDLFKDFLLENIKFDSPSSSRRADDKNGYSQGIIIKKDNRYVFTLNLQLRFVS